MLVYLLVVVISYFMGTISCAYLISKYIFSKDIRQYGSKNPGTTNMLRTFGKKAGAVTLVGDYLKGTIAVLISSFLAKKLGADPDLARYISALAVVFYIIILLVTRYVSIASMLGVCLFPILMLMTDNMSGLWLGILLSVSVVYKHRENIRKLLNGRENRLGTKTR